MLDRRSTILEIVELQTHLQNSIHTKGALMAMKKRLCALEDDRKFKDRKFEKFHAELIIRQQKCGKVDLKRLSASQAEFPNFFDVKFGEKLKNRTKRTTNLKQSCITNSTHMRSTEQANGQKMLTTSSLGARKKTI